MMIFITPANEDIFEFEWPDYWRIPTAGEHLLIDAYDYVVESVQWEFQQGDDSVQVRVVNAV